MYTVLTKHKLCLLVIISAKTSRPSIQCNNASVEWVLSIKKLRHYQLNLPFLYLSHTFWCVFDCPVLYLINNTDPLFFKSYKKFKIIAFITLEWFRTRFLLFLLPNLKNRWHLIMADLFYCIFPQNIQMTKWIFRPS